MDLDKLLEEWRLEQEELAWEGTFSEYLQMVIKNPSLARLSHARVYDMLTEAGVEENELGERQYGLFSSEVYGLERALARIVDYFNSAARRLEVRKRMLLLLGPPSTGKSTIVNILKKGLEEYTATDAGSLYAIKGCPMQEEPLHLIPERLRSAFEEEYGIYIEGDLCPHCRYLLRDKYDGKVQDIKVIRVVLSERQGIGMGTYVATDPGSQDISRLVGTVDLSVVGEDRVETAGRGYRLDGELNVANRGIMDFIEMFKCNELFLTTLVTVTQEQSIKMGRFGTVYADEAIVAHSNEGDYREFVENKHTEALQDRIVMVKIPYNLRVSEEIRIYQKLLKGTEAQKVHFAPLALRAAAILAVLSRMDPSLKGGISLMEKLALYDGEYVRGFTRSDVEEMQNKAHNEGLTGISPRYVVNRLSALSADTSVKCADPLMVLQALADGLEQHIPLYERVTEPIDGSPRTSRSRLSGLSTQEEYLERLQSLFVETRKEYNRLVTKELQKAYVDAMESRAQKMFDVYIAHVTAFVNKGKLRDPASGQEVEPDEKFMRQIEDAAQVREYNKETFRKEVLQSATFLEEKGRSVDYTCHSLLRTAIEKRLFPDPRDIERVLLPGRMTEQDRTEKLAEITHRLIDNYGYCEVCAQRLIEYVSTGAVDQDKVYFRRREPAVRDQPPSQEKKGRFSWLWG